jgi:hypothetical protein
MWAIHKRDWAMNKAILIASVLAFALGASSTGHSCDDGYAIEAVLDDGNVIKLDDGSLWEVDQSDAVAASVWSASADVLVCDDKIMNVDDEETVHVHQIR